MLRATLAAMTVALAATTLQAGETPAPSDAEVYIIEPANGATINGPVRIVFGLRNMGVAPAGIEKENTGHHHLLINTGLPDAEYAIPNDDNHRHFGGGQTEAVIDLPPGTHTLQLLLGDWSHVQHANPVMSEVITITVE